MARNAVAQMLLVGAALFSTTAAAVSQQKDWLVHRQDSKTRLLKTASGLRLTNGLIERTFAAQPDGYFCTTDLSRGDRSFFRALSPEANLTINGQPFNVGGCLGQPDNRYEFWYAERWPLAKDPDAFAYRNYSLTKPSKSFEWRARSGAPDVAWPPKGLRLTVEFAHASLQNVRVFIHYEMYDNIPAFRKLVSVRNDGSETVTVSSLIVELFRAQNFAPQRITALAERWQNEPVPNDQQVPAVPDSLLRESPRYWYADPSYDQCCANQCMNRIVAARRRRVDGVAVWPPNSPIDLRAGDDTQLHVPYSAYTFLVAGYVGDVRFGGGTGPGWVLAPGTSKSSSSLRVVLHDDDSERQGLGVRETLKAIAPQLTEAPVNFMLSDISSSSTLRRIVDQAAKTGHELGIIGFGAEGWCAFCSEQTEDSNFTAWLANEVRYARSKNIKLSAYTLMQGNGWGMDPIPEDAKILNRDGSRGPTACFATDWHASYRQRVLTFAAKVGFYGVETDGQFEGASCSDPTHSHHGVSNSFDAQLKATQRFNNQLKARGLYQTGADAYVFSGANRWNAADTDEAIFHIENVVEWSTLGRMYAYDSTFDRVPTSGQYTVDDLVGRCTSDPLQTDLVRCVDFVLGGFYLFGTQPFFHAVELWDPLHKDAAALEASVTRWTGFFRQYRERMLGMGRMLHLRRPTARYLEAVAHVTSDASEPLRAVVGLVNPTSRGIADNITVSLYYAGLAPGATVVASVLNADAAAATSRPLPAASTRFVVGRDPAASLFEIVLPVKVDAFSYASIGLSLVTSPMATTRWAAAY